MIITGCLAVVSDVIESYCHHKPTSSNVPSSSVASPSYQKGQSERTLPIFAFSSRFFLFFSDFFPSFSRFLANFSLAPSWLCKIVRMQRGQKHKDTAKCGHGMAVSDYAKEPHRPTDISSSISDVPENRIQICVTEDSSRESQSVNMETEITWKELASAINKLMFLACMFITVASTIIIVFNFVEGLKRPSKLITLVEIENY